MRNELVIKIENLRDELCFLTLYKKLTDNEVVSCSQELDKLILEYQQRIIFEHQLGKILKNLINSD